MCDVFSCSVVFYGEYVFGEKFIGIVGNDVRVENFFGGFVGEEFYYVFRIVVGLCVRVGGEWKFIDDVFDVYFFDFCFSFFDLSDFGVGVNDGGDRVVVDVFFFIGDLFDDGDVFFFSFVC